MTVVGTTTAVNLVHAGASPLNGLSDADSFRVDKAVKITSSDSFIHGSTDEEDDALLEREEERLIFQEKAEQHMLSVALANSVADMKERTKAGSPSGDQVSAQGQLPPIVSPHGEVATLGGNGSLSMGEVGSVNLGEAREDVPSMDPKLRSSNSYCMKTRSKTQGVGNPGKTHGEGVWQGTRKRRRNHTNNVIGPVNEDLSSVKYEVVNCDAKPNCASGYKTPSTKLALAVSDPLNEPVDRALENEHEKKSGSILGNSGSMTDEIVTISEEFESGLSKAEIYQSNSCQGVVARQLASTAIPNSCLPVENMEDDSLQIQNAVQTSIAPVPKSQASFAENENNASAAMPPPAMPARRRIFSVDLDPTGFDFESSMGVAFHSPSVKATEQNTESLPPIAPLPSSAAVASATNHTEAQPEYGKNDVTSTTLAASARDRGMSFELFSFGVSVDEPLPPAQAFVLRDGSDEVVGRPRGDSIIFDPISFSDGGIHEESALRRRRRESISLDDNDELEIMNSPGFVEAPPSCLKPTLAPPILHQQPTPVAQPLAAVKSKIHVPSPLIKTDPSVPSPLLHSSSKIHAGNTPVPIPSSIIPVGNEVISHSIVDKQVAQLVPPKANPLLQPHVVQKCSSSTIPVGSPVPAPTIGVSGSPVLVQPPASDKVINMPHGSAAAAAAAMTVPSPVMTSSLNGTSTSHTACPMELLNKGGRIGIYLPEARKARIAKFHSKRKMRIWRKRIKYDCRKKLADSRPRIKGRFVKRSDMDEED